MTAIFNQRCVLPVFRQARRHDMFHKNISVQRRAQYRLRRCASEWPEYVIFPDFHIRGKKHSSIASNNKDMIQYPAEFSPEVKHLLTDTVLLSWLAYSKPEDVSREFEKSRIAGSKLSDAFEVLKWVESPPSFYTCPGSDAQCYLIDYFPPDMPSIPGFSTDKPMLAICARGTTSFEDWLCDGQIRLVQFRDSTNQPVDKVEVHRGFYRQFISLFSQFDPFVKSHLKAGGNLLCTGHSLGSSSSAIAALNYGRQYPTQVFYVGCGTPRVGNQAFADEFDRCVQLRYRLKHARDPVVSIVPPIDYRHVGQEIHLGATDPLPDIPILTDVKDHAVSGYAQAMKAPQSLPQVPTETQYWYEKLLKRF